MSLSSVGIEIVSSIQRRRRHSMDEKWRILQECSQPGMTVSYVARRHGNCPSLLFNWRRRMNEGWKEAVRVDDDVVSSGKVQDLDRRVRKLGRVLGKKALESEILQEAVRTSWQLIATIQRGTRRY